MKRSEFIKGLWNTVDDIELTDVALKYGVEIKGSTNGRNVKALCPFHGDTSVGSFTMTNSNKVYKCFSCGHGGKGAISFFVDLHKQDSKNKQTRFNAMIQLAKEFNIITESQYLEIVNNSDSSEEFKRGVQVNTYKKEKVLLQKTNAELMTGVYNCLSAALANVAKTTGRVMSSLPHLTEEHYHHLKNERHLTDEDIIRDGYFSLPGDITDNSTLVMEHLTVALLVKRVIPNQLSVQEIVRVVNHDFNSIDFSVLKGVPGFFQKKYNNQWTLNMKKGLAMPIKNNNKLITALQVREFEGTSKYTFYTSSFADGTKGAINGVGVGTNIDVIRPTELKTSALFITEGKFKALSISKHFGATVLGLQGINSTSGLIDMVAEVYNTSKTKPTAIYITLDADVCCNSNIAKAIFEIGGELEKQFVHDKCYLPIFITGWNMDLGKGIDDMILNGHKSKLTKVEKATFERAYQAMYAEIKEQERLTTKQDFKEFEKNNKERMKTYFDYFVLSHFPQPNQ